MPITSNRIDILSFILSGRAVILVSQGHSINEAYCDLS
jgi:hypothetical protein